MYLSDYRDEFNYHAVTLIFGLNSPKVSDFKVNVYSLSVMQKHPEFKFVEVSGLTSENVPDTNRELIISPTRVFITNHCMMSSGVCRKLTFKDSANKILVTDEIFNTDEYEYFSKSWDDVIKNKVRTLGMLIRSIYSGTLREIPLLINEFPEITGVLLKYPEIWVREV